jgi:hypothetical protein
MIRSDPFQPLAALKRKRKIAQSLYGGRGIGQPNRTGLVGAQQPISRGAGRPSTGGGSSITTGPEQTPPEQEGLLGGLLQAKGAYEGVKEAATGGKNIRNYVENFDTRKLDPSNWRAMAAGYDFPTLPVEPRALRTVTGVSPRPVPEMPHPDDFLNMRGGGFNNTQGGFAGTPEIFGAHTPSPPVANISQLQSMSPQAAIESAPKFLNGTQVAQGSNLATNTSLGLGAGTAGATSAQQLATAANSGPGAAGNVALNTGGTAGAAGASNVGGKVATDAGSKAATNSGGKLMGKVGAGLGVGLSAYDISQNGLNFGNATGLAGSATLLALGASNPVGWALLGASAVDSIFDIF